jgi:hypothetical protein
LDVIYESHLQERERGELRSLRTVSEFPFTSKGMHFLGGVLNFE